MASNEKNQKQRDAFAEKLVRYGLVGHRATDEEVRDAVFDYAKELVAGQEDVQGENIIADTSQALERQILLTLQAREALGKDALTGAMSLRRYQEEVARLHKDAHARSTHGTPLRKGETLELLRKSPFALITFDVDHFKQVNDEYGHRAGNQVLSEIVRRIQRRLRRGDIVARVGGEEFRVVVLAANGNATLVAEALRRLIADTPFAIIDNDGISREITVTISLGVSPYDEETEVMETRSDEALYNAKGKRRDPGEDNGDSRNQVWVWSPAKGKAVRHLPPVEGAEAAA